MNERERCYSETNSMGPTTNRILGRNGCREMKINTKIYGTKSEIKLKVIKGLILLLLQRPLPDLADTWKWIS